MKSSALDLARRDVPVTQLAKEYIPIRLGFGKERSQIYPMKPMQS